jgi:hypothetical protein
MDKTQPGDPTEGADTPIPVTVLPDLLKSGTLRVPLPVPDLPGKGMQTATSVQLAEDPSQGMHFRVGVDCPGRGGCFVQMQLPSRSLHVRFSLPCGQMALPLTLLVRADGPPGRSGCRGGSAATFFASAPLPPCGQMPLPPQSLYACLSLSCSHFAGFRPLPSLKAPPNRQTNWVQFSPRPRFKEKIQN